MQVMALLCILYNIPGEASFTGSEAAAEFASPFIIIAWHFYFSFRPEFRTNFLAEDKVLPLFKGGNNRVSIQTNCFLKIFKNGAVVERFGEVRKIGASNSKPTVSNTPPLNPPCPPSPRY